LVVQVQDLLTDRLDVELRSNLLVLATGVVPHDISELVGMYRCRGRLRQLPARGPPKLRPVELAVSGVFLAGCCQGPMDITEAAVRPRPPPPRRPP